MYSFRLGFSIACALAVSFPLLPLGFRVNTVLYSASTSFHKPGGYGVTKLLVDSQTKQTVDSICAEQNRSNHARCFIDLM